MKNEKSVAVAGHLVFDEIMFADGATSLSLGGISYNLAALCSVMTGGRVIPVCEIGEDRYRQFDSIFRKYQSLDIGCLKTTKFPNVVNRLVYASDGSRSEWNSRLPEPLVLDNVLNETDALLVNFISGNDIAIDELDRFCASFSGLIYLDYHSLSLGRNPDGGRFLCHNPRWREYVRSADILQMNIAELQTIIDKSIISPENIAFECGLLHQTGPKNIIVTMGERGVVVSNTDNAAFLIQATALPDAADPTGCGDTLAAVTLHEYLRTADILAAVKEGARWASAKASFSGLEEFDSIDEILKNIPPPAITEVAR